MDGMTLIIISLFFVTAAIVTVVLSVLQGRRTKKVKKIIEDLEYEKNKVESTPIVPELAKIESFLKNEKMEIMYNDWKDRFEDIKKDQIPKLTDMILEADYAINQLNYKDALYKIAKLEMEIYKVRTNAEFLLDEIKDITTSDEKNRAIITNLKSKYRESLIRL